VLAKLVPAVREAVAVLETARHQPQRAGYFSAPLRDAQRELEQLHNRIRRVSTSRETRTDSQWLGLMGFDKADFFGRGRRPTVVELAAIHALVTGALPKDLRVPSEGLTAAEAMRFEARAFRERRRRAGTLRNWLGSPSENGHAPA